MNTKWFKTLSIKELSTWVKHFDNSNSMLNELFPNRPKKITLIINNRKYNDGYFNK